MTILARLGRSTPEKGVGRLTIEIHHTLMRQWASNAGMGGTGQQINVRVLFEKNAIHLRAPMHGNRGEVFTFRRREDVYATHIELSNRNAVSMLYTSTMISRASTKISDGQLILDWPLDAPPARLVRRGRNKPKLEPQLDVATASVTAAIEVGSKVYTWAIPVEDLFELDRKYGRS